MYPKVYLDFFEFQKKYSDPSILPTELFFYGPQIDREYSLSIEKGKSLILRYLAKGEINKNGNCSVFFEVNGQPRTIEIFDEKYDSAIKKATKADDKNSNEIGSPLPGQISQIFVKNGDKVIKGDKLVVIEAMKMETTISAEKTGKISNMQVQIGSNVESKDLLFEIID